MSINILQVASEITPLIKSGGLADVVSSLSQALVRSGHDCRVIIPKYSFLEIDPGSLARIAKFVMHANGAPQIEVSIYQTTLPNSQVVVYLVDASYGFDVPLLYPTEEQGDQSRFVVFGWAICEWLKRSDWKPQIIHGHDWMASPAIAVIKQHHLPFTSLLTIHNAKYQGEIKPRYLDEFASVVTFSSEDYNLLKSGLLAATKINTVSLSYAKEIHTSEYGYGIEDIIVQRSGDVSGIINGLDTSLYNTDHNPLVQPPYGPDNAFAIKKVHKQKMLKQYILKGSHKPLFAVVGRTGSQKGMDLLAEVIKNSPILEQINFIILVGRGTRRIEDILEQVGASQPESLKVMLGFDDLASHGIYAAADFIVMPSKYEPCGLSQLIGMRYGAIPVVRHTGGLKDTVSDISDSDGQGVTYANHDSASLLHALERAVQLYDNQESMARIVRQNMLRDFSWEKPVTQYIQLYQAMLKTDREISTQMV